MRRALLILLALVTLISVSAWGQTPPVADGFQFPNEQTPHQGNWSVGCNPFWGTCVREWHVGEDASGNAGDPVYAPANGVVKHTNVRTDYGNVIVIEHNNNGEIVCSVLGHLRTVGLQVAVGQTVERGDLLGYLGTDTENGGWSPHYHLGINKGAYRGDYEPGCVSPEWWYGGYTSCESWQDKWYDPSIFIANNPVIIGCFSDGWHDDGTSQAFIDKYRACRDIGIRLGEPHDNGGGIYVHDVYGVLIQDFHNIDNGLAHPYTSLVKGPNPNNGVFLLKEAFWYEYMSNAGWMQYGYPTSDEDPLWYNPNDGLIYTRQDFSTLNGVERYFLWRQGSDPIVKKSSDNTLINLFNTIFQINGGSKALGDDGIYYGDHLVASFGTPIHLLEGQTFSGLYALIGGVQTPINQFTVTGDMTIVVGGEEVPDPCIISNANTTSSPIGIDVSGDYAYISSNDLTNGIMEILNISNPLNPTTISSINLTDSSDLTMNNLEISGNYAYVCAGHTFKVIDISNPLNPILLGSVNTGNMPQDVEISGNYAYLANGAAGVSIINIANPTNPYHVTSINGVHHYVYVMSIVKDGQYLYATGWDYYMLIIDVSDPTTPIIISEPRTYPMQGANDMEIVGNYLYTASKIGINQVGMLFVVDISDRYIPQVIGELSFLNYDAEPQGISIVDEYAYISSDRGLFLVDISDRANPTLSKVIENIYNHGSYLVNMGSYVYVANGEAGFTIIQTTCGTAPAVSANFVGDPLLGVVNFDVSFHDYSTGYPTSWSWDFGDGATSTEQNPVHTYTMHGTFDVSLTVGNGTSSDTKTVTDMIVAKKPSPPEDPRYPYCEPNPFNPTSTIRFKLDSTKHVKLEIFDLRGRKVKTLLDGELAAGVHQATFDGRSLASGVYFYRLTDASGVQTHKMTLLK